MCGILGTNNLDCDLSQPLNSLHRGDDERVTWSSQDIQIGFNRHAIVNIGSVNSQPCVNDRYVTVANGELFDFQSFLKTGDEPKSDIDIFSDYIRQNGVNSVANLNMMMAAAIFDIKEKVLYLIRDWVGELPLYFTFDHETKEWAFGSTIASVIMMTKKHFSEVAEVPPGTIVAISEDGIKNHQYYDILSTPDLTDLDLDDSAKRLKTLLEASAKARTWTEAPVATLVSGGIDSLISTYLLLKYGNFQEPLPAYTFHCSDYPETENTDLYHARKVVEWFGDKLEHRIITATKDDIIAAIPEVVQSIEDVRGKDYNIFTALYNRFLAQHIANDGIKLVYEGEGPDEALGAYSTWRSFEYSDQEIGETLFRKKMVKNMHKGTLMRTSKVMMDFGPLECRSYYLDRDVLTLMASLPANVVRKGDIKKWLSIAAFKEEIPEALMLRPKARPQDSTGITHFLEDHLRSNRLDFRGMLYEHFNSL